MPTPRLSIALKDRHRERVPLVLLLDQALDVLNPPGRSKGFRASHLAQQALRAVCEAVVEDQCLTLPVQIYRPVSRANGKAGGVIEIDFKKGSPAPAPRVEAEQFDLFGPPPNVIEVKFRAEQTA